MTKDPDFKGYIHDVGGPTADFRQPSCQKQLTKGVCQNQPVSFSEAMWKPSGRSHRLCFPSSKTARRTDGVKKVFIRSGVRFDYVLSQIKVLYLCRNCVKYHVSRTAYVLHRSMFQTRYFTIWVNHLISVYQTFLREYDKAIMKLPARNSMLVPYFMSSHPGCTIKEAVKLAEYVRDLGYHPGTGAGLLSNTIHTFHLYVLYRYQSTGHGKSVYVPKDPHEKAIQRALMQYKNPANRKLVLEGLQRAGRMDLVGFGPKCLIRPEKKNSFSPGNKNSGSSRRPAHRTTIRNTHKKKTKK